MGASQPNETEHCHTLQADAYIPPPMLHLLSPKSASWIGWSFSLTAVLTKALQNGSSLIKMMCFLKVFLPAL